MYFQIFRFKNKTSSPKRIYQITCINDSLKDIEIEFNIYQDNIITSFIDVTEIKKAEQILKDSERRFRRLAENAKDFIYRMSLPDGKYEYASSASTEIFGYTPKEYNGTVCPT